MKVRCPKCGELIDVPKSELIGQMKIKKMKDDANKRALFKISVNPDDFDD